MVAASLEQLKQLSDSQKGSLVQPEQMPEAHFSALFLPSQSAGGDLYDVIHSGAGIYDYVVADISGHHAGTALPAAALKALLRQNARMLFSPSENLKLLNQHLRPVLQENQYATLVYCRLNRASMRLTLINAGHPSAIHYSPLRGAQVIKQTGDGLGLFDKVTLGETDIPISPGDRVFLFSDGLIEEGPEGSVPRRIGQSRLLDAVDRNASRNINNTIQGIHKQLHLEDWPLSDDVVLLGFEV